jgi:hypothetical protein
MDAATRELVRTRARDRCEYCLLQQSHSKLTHHVEHITAEQHGGTDSPDNLCWACNRCNLHKGPNLSGIDPVSKEIVLLFHPRRNVWHDHFEFEGVRIVGLTAVGRATVHVLAMNDPRRLELRAELLGQGEFLG